MVCCCLFLDRQAQYAMTIAMASSFLLFLVLCGIPSNSLTIRILLAHSHILIAIQFHLINSFYFLSFTAKSDAAARFVSVENCHFY